MLFVSDSFRSCSRVDSELLVSDSFRSCSEVDSELFVSDSFRSCSEVDSESFVPDSSRSCPGVDSELFVSDSFRSCSGVDSELLVSDSFRSGSRVASELFVSDPFQSCSGVVPELIAAESVASDLFQSCSDSPQYLLQSCSDSHEDLVQSCFAAWVKQVDSPVSAAEFDALLELWSYDNLLATLQAEMEDCPPEVSLSSAHDSQRVAWLELLLFMACLTRLHGSTTRLPYPMGVWCKSELTFPNFAVRAWNADEAWERRVRTLWQFSYRSQFGWNVFVKVLSSLPLRIMRV